MPNKKKHVEEVEEEFTPLEIVEEEREEPTILEKVSSVLSGNCGHVNRQSFNIDGKLEDVLCELPSGHVGDHSAKVKTLLRNPYQTKNPEAQYKWVEGAEYEIKETVTYWSDAAGTPAVNIQPDYGGKSREEWVQARRAKAQG